MMNRKENCCVACGQNHVCLTTQRLSPMMVLTAGEGQRQGEVQIQSFSKKKSSLGQLRHESSLAPSMKSVRTKWPLLFFNGIIFLFGSSDEPWRSLLAAHFTLCIDSDVQNSTERFLSNKREHLLHVEGNSSPAGNTSCSCTTTC